MRQRALTGVWATCISLIVIASAAPASAATDIVLYAADATTIQGNWARISDSTAAAGQLLSSTDNGWPATNAPLAAPIDYFEFTFSADANTPYRVWFRVRPAGNSKWNDSVWVQFSDSVDGGGVAIDRIGGERGRRADPGDAARAAGRARSAGPPVGDAGLRARG